MYPCSEMWLWSVWLKLVRGFFFFLQKEWNWKLAYESLQSRNLLLFLLWISLILSEVILGNRVKTFFAIVLFCELVNVARYNFIRLLFYCIQSIHCIFFKTILTAGIDANQYDEQFVGLFSLTMAQLKQVSIAILILATSSFKYNNFLRLNTAF